MQVIMSPYWTCGEGALLIWEQFNHLIAFNSISRFLVKLLLIVMQNNYVLSHGSVGDVDRNLKVCN